METLNIVDRCVGCGRDTAASAALLASRVRAAGLVADARLWDGDQHEQWLEEGYRDADMTTGYRCGECAVLICDRCDNPIPRLRDIAVGEGLAHLQCLTRREMEAHARAVHGDDDDGLDEVAETWQVLREDFRD